MTRETPHQPWTDADDATLRRMWARGDSSLAIAAKLGRSKNGVIGRAHRIGCAERGSPVGRAGVAPIRAAETARMRTLLLAGASATCIAAETGVSRDKVLRRLREAGCRMTPVKAARPPEPARAPLGAPKPRPAIVVQAAPAGVRTCQWIDGPPRGIDTVFCPGPAERGPYCHVHAAIAYVAPPARASDVRA